MDEEEYIREEEDFHWENNYQRILNIDDFTYENLKQMAAWGKRLSLAVFVLMFIIVFFCLMIVLMIPQFPPLHYFGSLGFVVICVLIACIFIYPAFELFQFSTLMSTALRYPHQGRFNTAIQHMNHLLRYMGILMIVFVSFSILLFTGWLLL